MTRYAVHQDSRELIAIWENGRGGTADVVATLPPGPASTGQLLAAELQRLSEAGWRTYTHPASAAGDPRQPDTEAWRRDQERQAFATAVAALRDPQSPGPEPVAMVEEAGHRVGRAVRAFEAPNLIEVIEAEVRAELDAIEQAEAGHLSDRAQQAVLLSREAVSPRQVQSAWNKLEDKLLDSAPALLATADPTSAAVAAAEWLQAAARVAAQAAGIDWRDVAAEADDLTSLPVTTISAVLDGMADGGTAQDVVLELVRGALAVADGRVSDLPALLRTLHEAADSAHRFGTSVQDWLRHPLTPLDPARPAADLLECLFDGIEGCFLLWSEHQWGEDTQASDAEAEAQLALAFQHEVRTQMLVGAERG